MFYLLVARHQIRKLRDEISVHYTLKEEIFQ